MKQMRYLSIEYLRTSLIATFIIVFLAPGCHTPSGGNPTNQEEIEHAGKILDEFHAAAARADFEAYFDFFWDDAVFIGTDATEHWSKSAFQTWAKPFFERGKAWDFTSIDRHIYVDSSGMFIWFDELLSTQMKICRGSGVLRKQNGKMKIQQYVLSMTIPNNMSDSVTSMKAPIEDPMIESLLHQKDNKE